MKITFIKSLLLVIAFLGVLFGVLFFFKTIVAPPSDVEQTDVYTPDVEKFVTEYAGSKWTSDLNGDEEKFRVAVDRISIFHSDGLISADKRDELLCKAIGRYFDCFTGWAYEKFNNKVWSSDDHAEMRRVIRELRDYKVEDGSKMVVTEAQNSWLMAIENILSDYDKAWVASRNTYYGNAPENITEAKKYRSLPYISNCTALTKALDEVPRKTMLSHYNHVQRDMRILSDLSSFPNRRAFNEKAKMVSDAIGRFKTARYGGVNKADYDQRLEKDLYGFKYAAERYKWQDERRY